MFYACGDYNINLLQSDANHKIASYVNSVTSSGSFCLIDKPTRLGESSATLLDHFYTNNLTTPITSGILESDIINLIYFYEQTRSPQYEHTHSAERSLIKSDNTERSKGIEAGGITGLQTPSATALKTEP